MLKKLFGGNSRTIQELLDAGGVIVDVRSQLEFAGAHLNNSINIPLDALKNDLDKLDKSKPVITCCASGIRSASAKRILKSNGFGEVINGGGWASLTKYDS